MREEVIRMAAFAGLIARVPPGEEVNFGELWVQAGKAVQEVRAAEQRLVKEQLEAVFAEMQKGLEEIAQRLRYEPPLEASEEADDE